MAAAESLLPATPSTRDYRVSTGVDRQGLRWYWQVVAFILAITLVMLRQPGAILHAQFFFEDGHVWFAEAYNLGWFASLFRTYSGYYATLPRLAAALALLVPLASAPLVMNLVGLFIQILPVPILLSARLSRLGSLPLRASFALIYLVMPNCHEVHVNVTNGQWHLALAACLVVLASAPPNRKWIAFDVAVLVLCGLTGPFCISLLLIACLMRWLRNERWRWVAIGIFLSASAIQVYALLFTDRTPLRPHGSLLGASVEWFARILAGQVYLGTLLGRNVLGVDLGIFPLALISLSGMALFCYWMFKAETEIRLFAFFAVLTFAGSLYNPIVPAVPGSTAWQLLAGSPAMRYWFFPTLACSWMLVWLIASRKKNQFTEIVGGALLLSMTCGFVRDFRHPDRPVDLPLAEYANRLAQSKPGDVLVIPGNAYSWPIQLKRH